MTGVIVSEGAKDVCINAGTVCGSSAVCMCVCVDVCVRQLCVSVRELCV